MERSRCFFALSFSKREIPNLISIAFPLLFGYYIYRMLKGGGAAGGEDFTFISFLKCHNMSVVAVLKIFMT